MLVFDEVTQLLQAQRQAAWGEVARRLAHEIRNPLTPIQLSAERMRRKLMRGLATPEAELLDRSTQTIVQQVEAMKQMVAAFSEYAKAPEMHISEFDLARADPPGLGPLPRAGLRASHSASRSTRRRRCSRPIRAASGSCSTTC